MRTRKAKTKREPTIALINVVFLMLVFFLIAGTVAPPISKDVTLVKAAELDPAAPPDGLVILEDGSVFAAGAPVLSVEAFAAGLDEDSKQRLRIIPDQNAPAHELLKIASILRSAGVEDVVVATERALE